MDLRMHQLRLAPLHFEGQTSQMPGKLHGRHIRDGMKRNCSRQSGVEQHKAWLGEGDDVSTQRRWQCRGLGGRYDERASARCYFHAAKAFFDPCSFLRRRLRNTDGDSWHRTYSEVDAEEMVPKSGPDDEMAGFDNNLAKKRRTPSISLARCKRPFSKLLRRRVLEHLALH